MNGVDFLDNFFNRQSAHEFLPVWRNSIGCSPVSPTSFVSVLEAWWRFVGTRNVQKAQETGDDLSEKLELEAPLDGVVGSLRGQTV